MRDPVARVVSLYGHLKLYSHAKLGTVEDFAKGAANSMTQQLTANDCDIKGIGFDGVKVGLTWEEVKQLRPWAVKSLI